MAFATTDDVATRLRRELDTADEALAGMLVASATAVIAAEVGKTWEWAGALDPVPPLLKAVCIEIVARVMENPDQLHSYSEQIGEHQQSKAFRKGAEGGDITLTDRETRLVRFAVKGTAAGYAIAPTLADRITSGDCPEAEGS
jgi:hypothetical protein